MKRWSLVAAVCLQVMPALALDIPTPCAPYAEQLDRAQQCIQEQMAAGRKIEAWLSRFGGGFSTEEVAREMAARRQGYLLGAHFRRVLRGRGFHCHAKMS